ncbi:hypothetical protein GCM10009566_03310 [Streptomyces murinus]
MIRPARASKETSSTAGGRALREVLVSPKAWITCSKIACDVRFFGVWGGLAMRATPLRRSLSTVRRNGGPVSWFLWARDRVRGVPVRPRGAASAG